MDGVEVWGIVIPTGNQGLMFKAGRHASNRLLQILKVYKYSLMYMHIQSNEFDEINCNKKRCLIVPPKKYDCLFYEI